MRVQQLRVGNLLMNFLGEVFEVNVETIYNFDLPSEFPKPKPIPASDEWLERLKNDTYEFYRQSNGNVSLIDDEGEGVIFYIGSCEYVHQIQNLFFALENRELPIINS